MQIRGRFLLIQSDSLHLGLCNFMSNLYSELLEPHVELLDIYFLDELLPFREILVMFLKIVNLFALAHDLPGECC